MHAVRGRIGEELVVVILWTRVRREYEFWLPRSYRYAYGYGVEIYVLVSVLVAVWYGSRLLAWRNLSLSKLSSVLSTCRYGRFLFKSEMNIFGLEGMKFWPGLRKIGLAKREVASGV